jgi:hypothetical protein
MTVFLRDEAGRVLSDWLLIPGVSFGPKQDYLYAGDRLAVQLDWSEGDSPVRRFVAVDHVNSTRVVVTDDGIESKIKIIGRTHARVVGARPHRKQLIAIVAGGGSPKRGARWLGNQPGCVRARILRAFAVVISARAA